MYYKFCKERNNKYLKIKKNKYYFLIVLRYGDNIFDKDLIKMSNYYYYYYFG